MGMSLGVALVGVNKIGWGTHGGEHAWVEHAWVYSGSGGALIEVNRRGWGTHGCK